MPDFKWQALGADGNVSSGNLSATDLGDLEKQLESSGLTLIDAREVREWITVRDNTIRKTDLIQFCFQLALMLKAGVSIVDALNDIASTQSKSAMRNMVSGLAQDLVKGLPLSTALKAHPKVFDAVMVQLVMAGERSGLMTEILEQLTETLKWQHEIASKAKQALVYPTIVLIVISLVATFLLVQVVPQITSLLESMRIPLPWQTQIIVGVSKMLTQHGFLLLLTLLGLGFGLSLLVKSFPAARLMLDRMVMRIPIVGRVLSDIALSRFSYVLSLLYNAGIPIIDALSIVEKTVGNNAIERSVAQASLAIRQGRTLSQAFATQPTFPPMVVSMLRVGEATGALNLALDNVSYMYTQRTRESVDGLQAALQPVLTVVLGSILMTIMAFTLGPLYDSVISNAKF